MNAHNYNYVESVGILEDSKKYTEKEHLVSKKILCKDYNDAVILPPKADYAGKRNGNWGKGGVVDSEGNFIVASTYVGDWATQGGFYEYNHVDKIIDDDVVYIGFISGHYGHFLVDCTTKLWPLVNMKKLGKNVKVAYTGDNELNGNAKMIINLLGINDEDLLYIDEVTKFRKVYVPEQSAKPGEWYTREYLKVFETIQENIKQRAEVHSEIKRKVYFTRTGYLDAKKKEVGEKTLEKVFAYNNFEIYNPERLSIVDMMEIINESTEVACINGTIPLNMIFSYNKNVKLIVLNKTGVYHRNLEYFAEICNFRIIYVDVYDKKFKAKDLGVGPFIVTVTDNLRNYFLDNGMKIPNETKTFKYKDYCTFLILLANRSVRDKLRPVKNKLKEILHK
ncbi:glycosyltransferase 61 family protein [Ligilactobacillus agilis]|uniref:glycosyltransferase 61 family protein n=1 Tax=Ligilactobacillus agilis TaxID=1601 RepID=UPI003D8043F0